MMSISLQLPVSLFYYVRKSQLQTIKIFSLETSKEIGKLIVGCQDKGFV
jgi:hypothetical protein